MRAVSTLCRSRYSVSTLCSRSVNGPARSAITGTPSSTTAASGPEIDSSTPATTP